MAFGPIDLVVLEFKCGDFNNKIIDSVTDLVSSEVVRVLDLVIVQKNEKGKVDIQELKELSPSDFQYLEPLRAEISGMITVDDIQLIGRKLKNGTTAAILLLENLWTVQLKQDVLDYGGRLVMHERIPSETVNEAIKDLADYED